MNPALRSYTKGWATAFVDDVLKKIEYAIMDYRDGRIDQESARQEIEKALAEAKCKLACIWDRIPIDARGSGSLRIIYPRLLPPPNAEAGGRRAVEKRSSTDGSD